MQRQIQITIGSECDYSALLKLHHCQLSANIACNLPLGAQQWLSVRTNWPQVLWEMTRQQILLVIEEIIAVAEFVTPRRTAVIGWTLAGVVLIPGL